MAKFRKKPVVIEAEQFVVWDMRKIPPFIKIQGVTFPITKDGTIIIPTLEGNMQCKEKDWVIRGVAGEYYPCKPEIFEQTYEEVK